MNILALHGFTGRGSDWDALRGAMPGHDWSTPDLPGHGPSPELPADLPAHLACVRRARDAMPAQPALFGYSMGARIALHAALALPGRFGALVLIGGSPGLEEDSARESRRLADATVAARLMNCRSTAGFLAEWDAQPLLAGRAHMPEPWKSHSLKARAANTLRGLAESLEGVGTGALPSLWGRLPEITLPVLLVVGENDTKFTAIARRMAQALPRGALLTVPEAGHAPHLERPTATAAVLAPHLAEPAATPVRGLRLNSDLSAPSDIHARP